MTFADWVKLPDLDKIVLVEIKVGKEVEGETWTSSSGAYYCSFPPTTYGEVVEVGVNGAVYSAAASIALCQSTASSFFYDFSTKRLYLHMVDGDSPDIKVNGVYKYIAIVKFWVCLTNRQPQESRTIYAPQGLTNVVYYLPYLSENSLPSVTQGVGNFYVGDLTLQFGDLTFVNDGWWYSAFENMIWHNAKTYVKVGAKGSSYADFATVFVGVARTPVVNDEQASVEVRDFRTSSFKDIPLTSFSYLNYMDGDITTMDTSAEGQPIPIPFGRCRGVIPVCIDIFNYKYKVSAKPINAITAVYEAGIALYPVTEYTVDLANGEFTLLNDPGDHLIECDIEGVLCGPSNTYSDNFADFVKYLLTEFNDIVVGDIDNTSYSNLRTERTQKGGYYVNSFTASLELVRLFQASAVFQLVPTTDGKWYFKYYTTGAGGTSTLKKEDLEGIGIKYDTDGVFYKVNLTFLPHPATGEAWMLSISDDRVKWRYGEKGSLDIATALFDPQEAIIVAQYYLALVSIPPKYVDGTMGALGLNMNPADKLLLSKTIKDAEGNVVTIFDGVNSIYRALEFRKNLTPANVGFSALDDSIASASFHADSPHGDHTDQYHTDIAHTETAHIESAAYEDHADVDAESTHSDVAQMNYHVEIEGFGTVNHTDGYLSSINPYWDYADNGGSGPTKHTDESWSGGTHINYGDYGDHDDFHGYYWDTPHTDAHTDVAHANSHIENAHGDSAHVEVAEVIDYTDAHTDIPHSDSFMGAGGVSRQESIIITDSANITVV